MGRATWLNNLWSTLIPVFWFCLLPALSSRKMFGENDFRHPQFDLSSLTILREEIVERCPRGQERRTVYLYPWLGSDGIHEEELMVNHVVQEEVVEFTLETGARAQTIIKPQLNCMEQDSPELISIIQDHHLDPPSTLPLNIQQHKDLHLGDGQPIILDQRY